jgi:AcrR family transcriptional regulator
MPSFPTSKNGKMTQTIPLAKKARARTKVNIVEAAERLIGICGVNRVTMRQIVVEAGSAHNSAIAYHFRDFSGLVSAIVDHRLPVVDSRREGLLQELCSKRRNIRVRDLLLVFYTPLIEQVGPRGDHSYASFLIGLSRLRTLSERYRLCNAKSASAKTTRLLAQQLPHLSIREFWTRFSAVDDMVLHGIVRQQSDEGRVRFEELIDMAAAAMKAASTVRRKANARRARNSPCTHEESSRDAAISR